MLWFQLSPHKITKKENKQIHTQKNVDVKTFCWPSINSDTEDEFYGFRLRDFEGHKIKYIVSWAVSKQGFYWIIAVPTCEWITR